jgi:hypothetical protein
MPSFLLGGSWRVLKAEIDKWIVSGGGKPSGSVPAKTDGRERSQRKPKPRS